MHIVVCIKQVPDTTQVKIDPETNTLIRAGVESICNPYDLVAAEAAVRLTEKYGGKATVITMGPPQADSALRDCLALGVTDAVLLSDRAFAGADTLATSLTLAQAVLRLSSEEPVDLVMCGKQAIDGDTAQVGPGIATRLGFSQFTYVSEILDLSQENRTIRVRREVEGATEVMEGSLPALLTVELELCNPRYASLPALVRAIRYDVKTWGAVELDTAPEKLGLKGSPTSVNRIFTPPQRTGGAKFDTAENPDKAIADFAEAFFQKEGALVKDLFAQGTA